jgi:tetratricopeptide (TPR) repeat protein
MSSGKAAQVKLGDLLVRAGMVPQEVVGDAMRQSGSNAARVGEILLAMNYINKRQLDLGNECLVMIQDGSLELFAGVLALRTADKGNMSLADALTRTGYTPKAGAPRAPGAFGSLADFLVEAGILTQTHIDKAQLKSRSTGMPIGRMMVTLGYLPESFLDAALNAQLLIREGRIDRNIAMKALAIAHKRQITVPMEARKQAMRADLQLKDLVMIAGIATEFDVHNATELGIEKNKDVGTMLVQGGLISKETFGALVELWQAVRGGNCLIQDACQELREVHNAFPVRRDQLAAMNAPPAPTPPPEPEPPPQPTISNNPLGNVIMPADQQRVIQLGGSSIIMPQQEQRGVIQLGAGPSTLPPEVVQAQQQEAAAAAAAPVPAPVTPPMPPPAPTALTPSNPQYSPPTSVARATDAFAQALALAQGFMQPATAPSAPKDSVNAQIADAMAQMFKGLQINEQDVHNIQEQWRKEDEDSARFKQELAAATANDQSSASAVTGIRSQEMVSSESAYQDEQAGIVDRQKKKKRNIMIGAGAGVAVLGAIICIVMMSQGTPATADIESAKKHLEQNMRAVARQEIKMALSKQPDNSEALLIYGTILFKDGEFKPALETLEAAKAAKAKLTDEHVKMMAESAVKEKQWAKARSYTEELLKKKETPELLAQLARIERDSGNPAMAIDPFDKAIAGGYQFAYRERGELFIDMKQPRRALPDLDMAIKLKPGDMKAHFLRGRAYLQTNNPDAALKDFAEASAPDKPDSNVLAYQAHAFNRINAHSEAIDAANKALQIDRNSIYALMARGDAFMARGAYRRAENDFIAVLQIDPNNADAQEKKRKAYVGYMRSDAPEAPAEKPAEGTEGGSGDAPKTEGGAAPEGDASKDQ